MYVNLIGARTTWTVLDLRGDTASATRATSVNMPSVNMPLLPLQSSEGKFQHGIDTCTKWLGTLKRPLVRPLVRSGSEGKFQQLKRPLVRSGSEGKFQAVLQH